MIKILAHASVFVLLTLVTQVGGIVYLLALYLAQRSKLNSTRFVGLFFAAYLITTFLLMPLMAPWFGRVRLPYTGHLRPLNALTCLLNRHYVVPPLRAKLIAVADEMNGRFVNTNTYYLDANFPFFDGFPLLPHLSHDDGKKVDVAFYYQNRETGEPVDGAPAWIGYGVYDDPLVNEVNYPERCAEQGFWQYGFLAYFTPQGNKKYMKTDTEKTRKLIATLAADTLVAKVFIEPHLKDRWQLSAYEKVRFHGCQAVRHDDHIHLQIR